MTNIAETITNVILARLEEGTKPWVQPWNGTPVTRPLRHCGTAYRGINVVLLWMAAQVAGYASSYWMTYNQAKVLKGQVRRGEKASIAVLYKPLSPADPRDDNEDHIAGDDTATRTRRVLRSFAVFNADQIDGLPERYRPAARRDALPASIHRERLDEFFERIPAIVRHGGAAAYYDRARDHIAMPLLEDFTSYEGYFATRAHETTHWSGAAKRLNRSFGERFGDAAYAFEELVADIGAAMLGASLGLPEAELENHAAYVGHWIKVLKHDRTAILTAASKADEACEYILGLAQSGPSTIVHHDHPVLRAA